jgi:acyl-CoA thioesterase-1
MRAAPNLGPDYGGEFEAIYASLVKTYGVQLYPFFLEGVAGDPALNQADGLHANAKGVEIIVQKMLPSVEALLKQVKP